MPRRQLRVQALLVFFFVVFFFLHSPSEVLAFSVYFREEVTCYPRLVAVDDAIAGVPHHRGRPSPRRVCGTLPPAVGRRHLTLVFSKYGAHLFRDFVVLSARGARGAVAKRNFEPSDSPVWTAFDRNTAAR